MNTNPEQAGAVLALEGVGKTFAGPEGAVRALADVNLTVGRGEWVTVRGPSGSGKSTLLLIAGGLLQPSSGTVLLNGRSLGPMGAEERHAWRAARTGFVFQQFHLIPYLTVLENVRVAALAAGGRDAGARAESLVEKMGLAARRHHVPAALSMGEQQRTALARALLNAPSLILADEPTGNLDPENGRIIFEALKAYTAEGGAVLLVTHDPAAEPYARRRYYLQNGKLQEGTP